MFHVDARILLIAFLASIIVGGCSRNSPPAEQTAPIATPATNVSDSTQDHQAVRAYIDPVTGQLRDPTREELAAEAAEQAAKKKPAASQSEIPKSREIVHPDGSVEIILDQSTQQTLQGCIQQNGDTRMDHACDAQSNGAKPAGNQR